MSDTAHMTTTTAQVLVLNSGSSSVKLAVIDPTTGRRSAAEVRENVAPGGHEDVLESMEAELVPIRSRAAALRDTPGRLDEALAAGAAACRAVARETMRGVRHRMGFA